MNARKFEMDFFRRMKVYTKVGGDEAKMIGAKVISTKWIDTNKGDEHNPDYRARLVDRQNKKNAE